MRITGTFLDEISHDIPHQNWGRAEWARDFAAMRAVGIDTVILIRCGYRHWMTHPSKVLRERAGGFIPPVDLVELFLDLAEENGMAFYFGTYDSGRYWQTGEFRAEVDLNKEVLDEAWRRYGRRAAFRGWYLAQEVSRRVKGIIEIYAELGRHCKALADLPVLISPWMDGIKAVPAAASGLHKARGLTPEEHAREWGDIMAGIAGAVDVVAFQDGHVDFHELPAYLEVNRQLARRHGLRCWSNCETFDRDMPIKFLPIKWEKLLLKLQAAAKAGVEKAITFEFSHFMSPHSAYAQAGHLYNRYREYLAEAAPPHGSP